MKILCIFILLLGSAPLAYAGCAEGVACGYATYAQSNNHARIHPGVSLSYMGGYAQHARVGARDFVIQGKLNDINKYLTGKTELGPQPLKVIAQTLGNDGHWYDSTSRPPYHAGGLRRLALTITNTGPGPDDGNKLIQDYVIQHLTQVLTAQQAGLKAIRSALGDILIGLDLPVTAQSIDGLFEIYNHMKAQKNISATLQKLLNYYAHAASYGGQAVDKASKLSIELTTYPAPPTVARMVCVLRQPTMSVADIQIALNQVLNYDYSVCVKGN
jgi:hypothetical protein